MFSLKLVAAAALTLAMGTTLIHAADDATTQPSDAATTQPSASGVPKRFADLSGLTDDQKTQIAAIHKQANDAQKAIDKKEEADTFAVLTDDQKSELKKIEADRKAKIKADHAETMAELKKLKADKAAAAAAGKSE